MTTGPSETTESDVAGPLPPPSGRRGDVLPAPRSADISSPARLHGDHPTPEPLERSNRPRSTLPLVALGAAVAVVLACVGLALAVRFGGGDDADTGSLGGDTDIHRRFVEIGHANNRRGGGHCDDGGPRDERGHHRSCGRHSQCAAVVEGFGRRGDQPGFARPVAEHGAPAARLAATVCCRHKPKQQCRRQRARRSAAIGDAQRRVRAVLVGRSASCGHVGLRRLEHGAQSRSRLGNVNDEELEDGYGSLDRATLLLVDARRRGDNDELLFVLVANERAGAQTTLYCAQSTVSSTGVVQPRSATVLQRSSGTNGLADVQANPPVVDLIRDQCDWR